MDKRQGSSLATLLFAGLLLIVCLGVSIGGLGNAYRSVITPLSSRGDFHGIHGDRWLEDGARITLYGLAPRGNFLDIQIGDWFPEGKPVPHVRASVCGTLVSAFDAAVQSRHRIYLTGDCEPREVSFEVANPFVASAEDARRLGPQIHSVQVSSKGGVPLLAYDRIMQTTLAVFFLVVLVGYALKRGGASASPAVCAAVMFLVIPLLSFFVLSDGQHLNQHRAWSLWLCASAVLSGGVLALGGSPLLALREMKGSVKLVLLLGGFTCFGALLRFYSLDFGLPNNYHPDEVPKYNAIMRMRGYGDLNPRYFLHPTLLLYMTYFFNVCLRGIGYVTGSWEETLIYAGRHGSALAGTLSIPLVYGIGRNLWSRRVGLTGAALLAVFPLHVTCSRYVKEDALLTFFIVLSVFLVSLAVRKDRPWILLLAGLTAGFSASVKYSGFLSIMILVGTPWLKSERLVPDRRFFLWMCGSFLCAPLGFLIASPYVILDSVTFLRDFGHETSHMDKGHSVGITAWSQYWLYHFSRSMIPGMHLVPACIAIAGMGFALARRRWSDLYLVCLVLLYYLPAEYVRAKPAPQPERYILPCLPFLALAGGLLFEQLSRVQRVGRWTPSLLVMVLLLPAVRTVDFASDIPLDTRERMEDWMRAHLPHGARVAVDWKPYSVRFHEGEFEQVYLPRADLVGALALDNLYSGDFDYLVLSSLWYRRHFKQPDANPAIREHIRTLFREVPIVHEEEARHGTYGFHNPRLTLFTLKPEERERLAIERNLKAEGKIVVTTNEARASFRWAE